MTYLNEPICMTNLPWDITKHPLKSNNGWVGEEDNLVSLPKVGKIAITNLTTHSIIKVE